MTVTMTFSWYRLSLLVVTVCFCLSTHLVHVSAERPSPSTSGADTLRHRPADVQSIDSSSSTSSEDVSKNHGRVLHSVSNLETGDELQQVKHVGADVGKVQTVPGKEAHDNSDFVDGFSPATGGGRDQKANAEKVGLDEGRTKRKWGKVSLQAWGKREDAGKRKWGATNSLTSWGKRLSNNNNEETNDEAIQSPPDRRRWGRKDLTAWGKRKWGAKSTFAPWGKRKWNNKGDVGGGEFRLGDGHRFKRSAGLYDDIGDIEAMYEPWRTTKYKRQWRRTNGRYNGPKRTWETNTMKAWGKRNGGWPGGDGKLWNDNDDDDDKWKRAWSSDNSLRIWGKRNILDGLHDWDRHLELL